MLRAFFGLAIVPFLPLALLVHGCSDSSPAVNANGSDGGDASADAAPVGPTDVTFPESFFFGSATSSFQVENNDVSTDWGQWVAMPDTIDRGDKPEKGGPNALAHIDDDVRALTESHQNAYRFSIEWARIYPTRESFDTDKPDDAALAAYESLLDKLHAANITPFVTLHHFSFPTYIADATKPDAPQGWERSDTPTLFAEFAKRMATRWAGKVDYWMTINEPLILALGSFGQGSFPPGVYLDMNRVFGVLKAEALSHVRAFDAIVLADTVDADGDGKPALVSVAAHQRAFHPFDSENSAEVVATARAQYLVNRWFLNAIVRGDWDDDLDEKLDGPLDKTADPAFKGRAHWIGINYYSDTTVSLRGLIIPILEASMMFENLKTGRPRTDLAWDIYPEGLGAVLDEAKQYGLPLMITENGLADSADKNRGRFLLEHLYQVGWALQRGADVRGYLHWSLIDNFEWAHGFCPRFGLYTYDPGTLVRTRRPSVEVYERVIRERKVTTADINASPPYSAPASCL